MFHPDSSSRLSPSLGDHGLPDLLFSEETELSQNVSDDFHRTFLDSDSFVSQILDVHSLYRTRICYLRLTSNGAAKTITVSTEGTTTRVLNGNDFASLVAVSHRGIQYTVWLPQVQAQFRPDKHGRIENSEESTLSCEWSCYPRVALKAFQHAEPGEIAVIPYVVLEDPKGVFFEELSLLSDAERRLYRKSDWFHATAPLDVWKYLINGSLYDPRSTKGIDKRFKCQQCAFAWWGYFKFLHALTGKKIYGLLQDEIAHSVLLDLSAEGEWGHGFWSDEIETHARFHLDGLHLLLSQYEKTGNSKWLEAAEHGMEFVFKHLTDKLDDDTPWFLHDTLEQKSEHRLKSTVLGKSAGNSLCINTHVQALTVLYRLSKLVPGKAIYADKLEGGAAALCRVLNHQPGELFYRFLAFMLRNYYQRSTGNNLLWVRIKNAVRWRAIVVTYWSLRRLFPRLVHPHGFIDRDLTLSIASDNYHITNLKDLLTLYQQRPYPWLLAFIKKGFGFCREFVQTLGLRQAIGRSPYYFEFVDVLHLYNRLIEPLPPQDIASTEETVYKSTGGYSLDYYASELVRGREIH